MVNLLKAKVLCLVAIVVMAASPYTVRGQEEVEGEGGKKAFIHMDRGMGSDFIAIDDDEFDGFRNPARLISVERPTVILDTRGDLSFAGVEIKYTSPSEKKGGPAGKKSELTQEISAFGYYGSEGMVGGAIPLGGVVLGVLGGGSLKGLIISGKTDSVNVYGTPALEEKFGSSVGLDVISPQYQASVSGGLRLGSVGLGGSVGYLGSSDHFKGEYANSSSRSGGTPSNFSSKSTVDLSRSFNVIEFGVGAVYEPAEFGLEGLFKYSLINDGFTGNMKTTSTSNGSTNTTDYVGSQSSTGGSFVLAGKGTYRISEVLKLGGRLEGEYMTATFNNPKIDSTSSSGDKETTSKEYKLAEGSMFDVGLGAGIALEPDDKTVLGLDYLTSYASIRMDMFDEGGKTTAIVEPKIFATSLRVGAERWISENLALRVGIKQNPFYLPLRTVAFMGGTYVIGDFKANYSYDPSYLDLSRLTFFPTLDGVINEGGHRIFFSWNF